MSNSQINIAEINQSLQQSYIHYDPQRVDYTVSNLEMELIQEVGSNIWKDIFLATVGFGLPTLINGYCDYSKLTNNDNPGTDIFLNIILGGISLGISIICLIVWRKNAKSFDALIAQIKNKPRYLLPSEH